MNNWIDEQKMLAILELGGGWTDDASVSPQGHQLSNKDRR